MMDMLSLDLPEILRTTGFEDHINQAIIQANAESNIAIIVRENMHPYSEGWVSLPQNRPDDTYAFLYPNFTYRYFSDETDIDRKILAAAMKDYILRYETTPAYIDAGAKLIEMPGVPCFDLDRATQLDEFIDCMLTYFAASIWHPAGTCRFGTDFSTSVVDQATGQVHGIQGVRVADASV